jgi:hypothetical protein
MAFLANTAATDWSWGALAFDMDNDGWKDLYVCNGILRDITSMDFADFVADKDSIKAIVETEGKFGFKDLLSYYTSSKLVNYAFVNQRNKTFLNLADSLGFGEPTFSNGAAYGDLDNDGDLDLVVNNLNMPSFIYRNNAENLIANNYLKVKLKGPAGNSFGVGAKVTVYANGNLQVMHNFTSRGFESAVEPILNFGVGKQTNLDSIQIIWPDHKMQMVSDIPVNQEIELDYQNAEEMFSPIEHILNNQLFEEISGDIVKGNIVHRENEFNDFNHERLLPKKISSEGPKLLKGDINGDGLEDFIMLGAFGDSDKTYLQTKDGRYTEHEQLVISTDAKYESTCGVLTDTDNDGDLDLIIGSGGNELDRGVQSYFVRYYENDGKGIFTNPEGVIPSTAGNFSVITAGDFDNDGDEDVFIGGRIVPGNYGLIPRSFLWRNDDGFYMEISGPALSGVGMVTDAVWSDFNCDSYKDLILVGDWMPIQIFLSDGTILQEPQAIPNSDGWWNSIEAKDLNEDGIDDYVLGNWGKNTKFTASPTNPMTMFVKDFDRNGKSDFIINWKAPLDSQAYPFASKMDLTAQMPILKKNSLSYAQYAGKTYKDLVPELERIDAIEYHTTTFASSLLFNYGENRYDLRPLPVDAQVSPVYATLTGDFDGDGHVDILLMGNNYGLKPEVGRQDANRGVVLKGDGNGNFKSIPNIISGINVKGQVRDIELLNNKNGVIYVIAINDDRARFFK